MLHGYSQSLAQPTWAYMDFVTVVLPAPGPNDADPCQTAGRPVAFHLAFLRDNCPKAVNASSGQKAHSSGALPAFGGPGLQITFGPGVRGSLYQSDPRTAAPLICHVDDGADTVPEPADGHPALRIVWPDGNASTFTASWLRQRAYDRRHLPVGEQQTLARSALRRHLGPKALYWDAQSIAGSFPEVDFAATFRPDLPEATLKQATAHMLHCLHKYGLLVVKNVPCKNSPPASAAFDPVDQSRLVSERVAPLMETFYGLLWDVVSLPDAENVAYTNVRLDLHQDLLYFESPPGIQLLHCQLNTVAGGEALFSDSFAQARHFRREYPDHYETLLRTPVAFHYRRLGRRRRFVRTTFEHDGLNEIERVNYSPPFMAPVEGLTFDEVQRFYEAFALWEQTVSDARWHHTRRYAKGDLIVFDNRRVLHARTAFESATGERHLRGSYLRLDDWRAAWRQHCGGTAAGGSDADDCPRSDWGWEDPTAESE